MGGEAIRTSGALGATPGVLDRQFGHVRIVVWREGPHSAVVEWTSEDRTLPAGSWSWRVERSASPCGPFLSLATGLGSNSLDGVFRDDSAGLGSGYENTRFLYYRVARVWEEGEVVHGLEPMWEKPTVRDARGVTWDFLGQRTVYAGGLVAEARARVRMMLENHEGEIGLLYRPAWDRGSCAQCVDPRTGERHEGPDRCSSCFGFGYVGGVYPPILIYMAAQKVIAQRVSTPAGGHDLRPAQVYRLPASPLAEPDDIIRFLNGSIWQITHVEYEELHGQVICQVAHLSQLSRNHPLTSVPLPQETRKMSRFSRAAMGGVLTNLTSAAESSSIGPRAKASVRPPDDPWGNR